jgi:hypothetical protein
MRNATFLLFLTFPLLSFATSHTQLRECSIKSTDSEKLACFQKLVDESAPPRIDRPLPGTDPPLNRLVVHGELAPAFPWTDVDVFAVPATISIARSNNRSSTDVQAAAIYHRTIGTSEDNGLFTGIGWVRKELGEDRSDARTLILGAQFRRGTETTNEYGERQAGDVFIEYAPFFSHSRDIYKKLTTDLYGLDASIGWYASFGARNDARNTFSINSSIESSQTRPDVGADRDALTASLGVQLTYGLTESVIISASPIFYDYLDQPFGTNEGSGVYGQLYMRWDLDPAKRTHFRPYLLLTRQFGKKPEDGTWIANQTSLALGVNFDKVFRAKQ